MKSIILALVCFFAASQVTAQQPLYVPRLDAEQKTEILYSHAIAYNLVGINYAKSKGDTPQKYGEYIGNLFKPFWNPGEGFPVFANGLMYILAGFHPNNKMEIVAQSEKSVYFRLKNVDLSFNSGPAYGITFNEFMECAYGILLVLSEHMNVEFSHKMKDEWYYVKLVAK